MKYLFIYLFSLHPDPFLAIRYFRWALEGLHFVMESDHRPLSCILHQLSDDWTHCQQRQLSFIAEFTSEIKHVAGRDNVVADALSRPAAAILPAEGGHLDLVEMACAHCPAAVWRDATAQRLP